MQKNVFYKAIEEEKYVHILNRWSIFVMSCVQASHIEKFISLDYSIDREAVATF